MAAFAFTDGVNESEPTMLRDGEMQNCSGCEYRVGQPGLFVARGRQLMGTAPATGKGLYEAGFDGQAGFLLAQADDSIYSTPIAATFTFSLANTLVAGSSAIVGCHYANRHYLAATTCNRRVESSGSGVTFFPIGMSRSTFGVGVSVSTTAGGIAATTGLVYWATEYDSVRGIESMTGASVSTGAITGSTTVTVFVTGTSSNPRANKIRWYRSVDSGGFPDGGLVGETAIGTTSLTDSLTDTGTLNTPLYGIVSLGGLDLERDEPPGAMSLIFGPFQDSLLGVPTADTRILQFTPAGYPDSWPSGYGIPIQTARQDEIVTGVVLPGRVGVFCKDSVQVVFRLPRDSDSVFAAGEAQDELTNARGCVSRRGACTFTPPGSPALAAWVARDGIWMSTLTSSPLPITDSLDWGGRVDISNLSHCRLSDDPDNRRLIFVHRRASDMTSNSGLWYLDYQRFGEMGVRVTYADHGPLVDAVNIATSDGSRKVASFDSRTGNGGVYLEATQDVDDSHLIDSSGSVSFMAHSKEFLPAGANGVVSLGRITWMHDAGPDKIEHYFYFDRRDDNPVIKTFRDATTRSAAAMMLSKQVNSCSFLVQSVGTTSYGLHWAELENVDLAPIGGRKGA
jgi:hypothetical protein